MPRVLVLFLFLFSSSLMAQETVAMLGRAHDKENKLIYTEMHTIKKLAAGEVSFIKTVYTNSSGKTIATLESDFSKDPYVPDTTFVDFRTEEKQDLFYDKDKNTIIIKITNKDGEVKTKNFPRTEDMVAGQGFHNYILKNFDAKRADIKFIVLSKMDFYSFYFEPESSVATGNKRFVLKISNWVLRALMKELAVEYGENDKKLKSFEGLTNIESDKGHSQILKIDYSGEQI